MGVLQTTAFELRCLCCDVHIPLGKLLYRVDRSQGAGVIVCIPFPTRVS